jgi:hypothetical protein
MGNYSGGFIKTLSAAEKANIDSFIKNLGMVKQLSTLIRALFLVPPRGV